MPLLTDLQTQAIKNRLGYGSLTASSRPYFDIAIVFSDIVQKYLDDFGYNYIVNTILPNLDQLDIDIMECRTRYKADKVGSIVLNKNEFNKLYDNREFWINELSKTVRIGRVPILAQNQASEVY